MVLLILGLLLTFDLAEDGCLGKAKFVLPHPSIQTSFASFHHSDSGQVDFRHELASADLLGSPRHADPQPVTPGVQPTLRIIHCCYLSSSGGIPL